VDRRSAPLASAARSRRSRRQGQDFVSVAVDHEDVGLDNPDVVTQGLEFLDWTVVHSSPAAAHSLAAEPEAMLLVRQH
jgi:hypothetical protein